MIEHRSQLPDGRVLAWTETGQGKPLVLLHGWAASAAAYSELASLLADDFRILAPDLPGHGDSSPAAASDLDSLAGDLVHWLREAIGEPFALAGWSLGGMLALQIARALQVSRLVLIGSTPRFTSCDDWAFGLPNTQVLVLARNLGRRFEATLGEFFALAFEGEEISAERLRQIRSFAVRASGLPDRNTALEVLAMLSEQDQRQILQDIHPPTLVLHGELDRISPVGAGKFLAEALPNAEFVSFAGVGHAPFLSKPHEVVAKLREFC